MKCVICKKVGTSNPDWVCGICHLKNELADYSAGRQEDTRNMPKGAYEQSKQETIEAIERR